MRRTPGLRPRAARPARPAQSGAECPRPAYRRHGKARNPSSDQQRERGTGSATRMRTSARLLTRQPRHRQHHHAHPPAGRPAPLRLTGLASTEWRIWGVPVLPVAGAGAIAFAIFCMIDAAIFHTQNGVSNVVWMVILPWVVVIGSVIYSPDARTLVLMITNKGKYTITRVEAQFSPDGKSLLPHDTSIPITTSPTSRTSCAPASQTGPRPPTAASSLPGKPACALSASGFIRRTSQGHTPWSGGPTAGASAGNTRKVKSARSPAASNGTRDDPPADPDNSAAEAGGTTASCPPCQRDPYDHVPWSCRSHSRSRGRRGCHGRHSHSRCRGRYRHGHHSRDQVAERAASQPARATPHPRALGRPCPLTPSEPAAILGWHERHA